MWRVTLIFSLDFIPDGLVWFTVLVSKETSAYKLLLLSNSWGVFFILVVVTFPNTLEPPKIFFIYPLFKFRCVVITPALFPPPNK